MSKPSDGDYADMFDAFDRAREEKQMKEKTEIERQQEAFKQSQDNKQFQAKYADTAIHIARLNRAIAMIVERLDKVEAVLRVNKTHPDEDAR